MDHSSIIIKSSVSVTNGGATHVGGVTHGGDGGATRGGGGGDVTRDNESMECGGGGEMRGCNHLSNLALKNPNHNGGLPDCDCEYAYMSMSASVSMLSNDIRCETWN